MQPGTYTIDARVAPLVNETNIANNDAFLTVTFVPYMIITDEFDFIQPTSPHQHELTTNVTLESGAGFAGTVTLTSPSISGLSIGFGSSSLSLASDSFAVTTMTIKIGEKATPGFYRLPVFAASGSFNFSSRVSAIVPSKDVTMPHLTWSETIAANGLQTWVATVSNTLSTPVEVFLDITCSTPQYRGQFGCAYSYDIIVAGKSKTTLTVSSLFGVFAGQNLPSSVKFTASLFFFDPRGGLLLSSDVLTGTFTIVP